MRLLIITTHPIQYNAPLFRYLAQYTDYEIKVIYTLGEKVNRPNYKGFGIVEDWNIDLLSGYNYELIQNTSSKPSSSSYWGIKNPSLLNTINRYNPEALLIYGWKHQSHLSVLKFFHGKILILFRGDSTVLDDSSSLYFWNLLRYTILKFVYQKVDYVLSPGIATDKYFLKSGLKENKIIRAEHAVDNERFMTLSNKELVDLNELRSSLFASSNEIIYLFAGKFISKKNPILLIKAFVQLKHLKNNVRLLFVGNGDLENNIKEMIASLPISIASSITLLPFQDQVKIKLLYRIASVFVLPSKSETWGLSVNEALACGIPVIVSDKCGCANDLVIHQDNGLVFESENEQDLVEKMLLMTDEATRMRLANKTKESLKKYSYYSFKSALNNILG